MIPLQPEQTEAAIYVQVILDRWQDEAVESRRAAMDRGALADKRAWLLAETMLRMCADLVSAAVRGDFDFMAKAAEGFGEYPIFAVEETPADVLARVALDLLTLYQGDEDKATAALNVIGGIQAGTCKVTAVAPSTSQMNRAARRRAARRR